MRDANAGARVVQYKEVRMNARIPILLLLLATGLSPGLPAQQHDHNPFSKTADKPGYELVLWENVVHREIWYFGWYTAPLGDINGDGYDDFAVSSKADTTFIFLGGDPFDHEPALIIRGGSAGVAAGDFNRDGRMDLVTAIENWPPGEWPQEFRGAIRVYLQKDEAPYFTWEEDMLIEGEVDELVGKTINEFGGSLHVLDYNGDGWPDLLTKAADTRDSVDWKGVLYLGGPEFDDIYDVEFKARDPDRINFPYIGDVQYGDINGDGYDDVLIWGMLDGRIEYWDVYLGNPAGSAGAPDLVISAANGWAPQKYVSAIMDIDADGYDDIIDAGIYSIRRPMGDALLFHGRAELPAVILPDDSIPNYNPRPLAFHSPQIACPVGDMNGDGTDDLLLAWNLVLFPGSSAYYFYPGGANFRTATGYFGTNPGGDFVMFGAFPAGDVNGDGYDDLLTLGRGTEHGRRCRFQIWIGAPQLRTDVARPPVAFDPELALFPNPAPAAAATVGLHVRGLRPGSVRLSVVDALGRERRHVDLFAAHGELDHALRLGDLPAGVYIIALLQGETHIHRTLVLY